MLGVMMTKLSLTFFLSYSLCTSLAEWHHPAINPQMEFHVLQSSIGSRLSLQFQRNSLRGHIQLIHLLVGLLPERTTGFSPVKINVCSRSRDMYEVGVKSVLTRRGWVREMSSRTAQIIARMHIKKDMPDAVHSSSSKVHSSAVQYITATEMTSEPQSIWFTA